MPDKPKPDLTDLKPQMRERFIERRNYWRAKRGKPVEIWDTANECLVDRDVYVVREAVARTVAALESVPSELDAAPAASADVPSSTAPAPDARPFHEMTTDEFNAEAAKRFDGLFDRDRTAPSPFFRGLTVEQ